MVQPGDIDPSQLPAPTTAASTQEPPDAEGPTQDVLNLIHQAKSSGKGVRIDFSKLHPDVDRRQVVSALMSGLPEEDQNKVNAGAMGGRGVAINFAQYPNVAQNLKSQENLYQDYPKWRFVARNIIRPIAEMGGQALGGTVGAALGTPEAPGVGTAALGMAGATAGGTAADELMNKIDTATGLAHPENQLPGQTLPRLGKEALVNAAMVGGGKLAGNAVEKLAAPFASSVNPEVQGAAQSLGVPLTASQQSNSKLLAQAEQMAAKLPGSSGVLGDFYAKTRAKMMDIANSLFSKNTNPQIAKEIGDSINQQLQNKVNELAQSKITPQFDPGDVGLAVRNDLSNSLKYFAKKAGEQFENIKTADTGNIIPTLNSAKQIQALADEGINTPAIKQASSTLGAGQELQLPIFSKMTNPADIEKLKQQIIAQGGQGEAGTSLTDLINTRQALSAAADSHMMEGGRNLAADRIGGAYQSIISAIDKDIQAGAPHVAPQYQAARSGWQSYASLRDNTAVRRILGAEQPETIISDLVKPGQTTNLENVLGLMAPETRDQFRTAFTNKILDDAVDANGNFSPSKLNSMISRLGDTANVAMGPKGATNLRKLANLSDSTFNDPEFRGFITQLGKKNGENVSGMLMGASPANINRVRALIGEDSFQEAQDGIIHNLLTNNQDNIDFSGLAKRMGDVPPESLATALPPEKIGILNRLATIGTGIKSSQREFSNPSGTAPMMGTFYLLRQLFFSPLRALQVLAGISGGAELYTSPLATKYLTQGVANPETANAIGSAIGKVPISVFGNTLTNPYKNKRQNP